MLKKIGFGIIGLSVVAILISALPWSLIIIAGIVIIWLVKRRNRNNHPHQNESNLHRDPSTSSLITDNDETPEFFPEPCNVSLDDPNIGVATYLDIETTGLSGKTDEIIEFAVALFAFNRSTYEIPGIIDRYTGLREPSIPIPVEATRINGIRFEDVYGKQLDNTRIQTILDRAEFLISHNAEFDRKFVKKLFPSVNEKDWLCSMRDIDWIGKGFYSKGLQNLLIDHRIKSPRAHRALFDVEAAIKLLTCTNDENMPYFSELMFVYQHVKNISKTKVLSRKSISNNRPGYYNGKHYTDYSEVVQALKREDELTSVEKLLLNLIDAIEAESRFQSSGVAPWYYEQLAIVYRKQKDYEKEVMILERFATQKHSPGTSPPKLLERLEKARQLASRSGQIANDQSSTNISM